LVCGETFFIFGGNKHHMAFNDFYILDLISEFEKRKIIDVSKNEFEEEEKAAEIEKKNTKKDKNKKK